MSPQDALRKAVAAVRDDHLDTLETILRDAPDVVHARSADGRTLLDLACRAATCDTALPPRRGTPGQHAAIERIFAAGADPAVAGHDGWAPLHTAAMSGHVELVRRLLAAGAPRAGRLMATTGGSPLALALFYAQREAAEALADPPVPDNLRAAAALGRPLDRFLSGEAGSDRGGVALTPQAIDGLDFYRPFPVFPEWPRTYARQEVLDEALTWAARSGRVESMAALVALGADVNANPYRGTALLWAIYADRVDAATWLLDHGADPDLRHDFGGAEHGRAAVALHLAAQYGALGCLRLLLERGADPSLRDGAFDSTPLGWAVHGEAHEAAAILREAGAPP